MKHKTADNPSGDPCSGEHKHESAVDKCAASSRGAHGPLRPRRILAAVDFSQCSLRALDYAASFALEFDAKVILLHVVEPAFYSESYPALTPPMNETNQNLLQAGRERLEELSQKRLGQRVTSETLVRIGHASSEIPDTAKALAADLIVLGTHGDSGLKHVLLGSTAERVVRHAPCPVLTVRYLGAASPEP